MCRCNTAWEFLLLLPTKTARTLWGTVPEISTVVTKVGDGSGVCVRVPNEVWRKLKGILPRPDVLIEGDRTHTCLNDQESNHMETSTVNEARLEKQSEPLQCFKRLGDNALVPPYNLADGCRPAGFL